MLNARPADKTFFTLATRRMVATHTHPSRAPANALAAVIYGDRRSVGKLWPRWMCDVQSVGAMNILYTNCSNAVNRTEPKRLGGASVASAN